MKVPSNHRLFCTHVMPLQAFENLVKEMAATADKNGSQNSNSGHGSVLLHESIDGHSGNSRCSICN